MTLSLLTDPVGRRILRSVVDNINSAKSNTKKYYYDGTNILAELDAGNNLTASYTHSPLRPDDILGAKLTSFAAPSGAISEGQVLAASAGNVYYLKDHLNTINEITNAAGDIIQKMDYSAFGVLRSIKDSNGNEVDFTAAPVRSSFTYTGREFEPELGMYYYRARYYDPNTGRFLQQDPDPGKLASPNTVINKYIYVGNLPTMISDPTGEFWWVLYVAIASLGATVIENQNGGNFLEQWGKNFAIGVVLYGAGLLLGGQAFAVEGWQAVALEGLKGAGKQLFVNWWVKDLDRQGIVGRDTALGMLFFGYGGYVTASNPGANYFAELGNILTGGGVNPGASGAIQTRISSGT